MTVSVKFFTGGSIVATVTYKPGFLVDVKVTRPFLNNKIIYRVSHPFQ